VYVDSYNTFNKNCTNCLPDVKVVNIKAVFFHTIEGFCGPRLKITRTMEAIVKAMAMLV